VSGHEAAVRPQTSRGVDYTTVTEAPGTQITREALDMMWTRYAYAAELAADRDVLEVACGAGQGLGHLARHARRVIGGDYTQSLLDMARAQYENTVSLVRLDGQVLPFRAASFDVVLLYEAIYYLPDVNRFLKECRRVLRPSGVVVVSTVNNEWADFNPSPFSTHYWSGAELHHLLQSHGFTPHLFGAFPAAVDSVRGRLVSALKRLAVSWHLMPKTMAGKRLLKRIFLGELVDFPGRLRDGMATRHALVPLGATAGGPQFKVLFAVARR
jgi:ubiquinone/menaquinone biosynthesis C-methylase UbiE